MLLRLSFGCGLAQPSTAPFTHIQYSNHHVPLLEPDAKCMPWPKELKRRRRWQNAFFDWYSVNEERFAIKLEVIGLIDTRLDVGFCGASRVITGLRHMRGNQHR